MSALELSRRFIKPGGPPRRSLRVLPQRVAVGLDLVAAAKRRDIARVMICWSDLVRG